MKNRTLIILISLFILGIICGLVFINVLENIDKTIIKEELNNYINLINTSSFNYKDQLLNTFISNFIYLTLILLFGFVFIFIPFTLFLTFYKAFCVGFLISSFIYSFKAVGLIYAFIFIFPSVILESIIYILFSMYSIRVGIILFNIIYRNKDNNIKLIIKNYLIIYLVFIFIIFISSLIEIFISSFLIKLVV